MRTEPARIGEIPPWAKWDLSEVGWKFPVWTYICQAGAFWFAEMHSLQYFQALSQGKRDKFLPIWNQVDIIFHSGELSGLASLARLIWQFTFSSQKNKQTNKKTHSSFLQVIL